MVECRDAFEWFDVVRLDIEVVIERRNSPGGDRAENHFSSEGRHRLGGRSSSHLHPPYQNSIQFLAHMLAAEPVRQPRVFGTRCFRLLTVTIGTSDRCADTTTPRRVYIPGRTAVSM
jgi:hypothetical protein